MINVMIWQKMDSVKKRWFQFLIPSCSFFLGGILKFRMDLEHFRKRDVFVVIQSQCSCPIQPTWWPRLWWPLLLLCQQSFPGIGGRFRHNSAQIQVFSGIAPVLGFQLTNNENTAQIQVYSGIAPVLVFQQTNSEKSAQVQVYSGTALVLKVSFENSEIVHFLTLVLLQSGLTNTIPLGIFSWRGK